MNTMQLIFLTLIFISVFIAAFVAMTHFSSNPMDGKLSSLMLKGHLSNSNQNSSDTIKWVGRIIKLAEPIALIYLPEKGWEHSKLRIRFINAGYRTASAPILFFAFKTMLTITLPSFFALYVFVINGVISSNNFLILLVGFATLGYFSPNVFLARRISNRKREILDSFPDALDLIIVCVEAGLGLDAALARVGAEMHIRSPILGGEFHLINLEMRAGSSREMALRNLALRTGVEDIDTLVTILIQSERFGTSVANSLRVHADSLRTKRRLRAEEAAAKIAVKLLFPLIFFIFPSMLVVLLGPAFISIQHILLPRLAGQ
jgi:tight adherence protein C